MKIQILNLQNAKEHSSGLSHYENIVVSENGNIHANCDINAVCEQYEALQENFFIVKGERKIKVEKKTSKTE